MKIRNRFIAILFVALVPMWIGVILVTVIGRESNKESVSKLMEEYTSNVATRVASFFGDAADAARYLATMQGEAMLPWEGDLMLGDLFGIFAGVKDTFRRVSFIDLDGYIYDAFDTGTVGNPWQGGRRTEDNEVPNSPAIRLNDIDYFRELVSDNSGGELEVVASEPYIPRGLDRKQFTTRAAIIHRGQPAGIVSVNQTVEELSNLFASLSNDLVYMFGEHSHIYIVSKEYQLVADIEYNYENGRYEDHLADMNEIVSVNSLGDAIVSAIDSAVRSGDVVFANIHGKKHFMVAKAIEGTSLAVVLSSQQSVMLKSSTAMVVACSISLWVMTAIMIAGIYFGTRPMTRSLRSMEGTMQELAEGGGDLTERLEVMGDDEIAAVGNNFNRFMGTLHGMVSNVSKSAVNMERLGNILYSKASSIFGNVSSINGSIGDLNLAAESQSASVTEASSTITQIVNNIESLTKQIERQATAVTESSAAAKEMSQNISAISENVSSAAESFDALKGSAADGKSSIKNVENLVGELAAQSDLLLQANSVINSIAGQTNLLAMNASIEAAHAGEAGLGFSVVAEEIRSLAENAAKQSRSIAEGLRGTISSINNIASATAAADKAFDSVVEKIEGVTSLISEINFSIAEHSSGSRQVLAALQDIENVTVKIRDGAVEMNAGSESILKEMTRLSAVSHSVKERSESIAEVSRVINRAVEEIVRNTGSNKQAIDVLVGITGKFVL